MPPATSSLLGLNLKFIPKPNYTTSTREIWEALDRLERDLHIKIFFAGSEDNEQPPLYVPNSEWRPDIEDIPHWLETDGLVLQNQLQTSLSDITSAPIYCLFNAES